MNIIEWGGENKNQFYPIVSMGYDFTALSVQNRSYEDRYTVAVNDKIRYYAVFDGHGKNEMSSYILNNKHVVLYIRDHLHKHLFNALGKNPEELSDNEIGNIVIELFERVDRHMYDNGGVAGSTCCIVLIIGDRIFQINLGDSKSILYTKDRCSITIDHEPILEESRIIEAGGFVEGNRVMGMLAMSRAFGDYCYKESFDVLSKEASYKESFDSSNRSYTANGCVLVRPDIIVSKAEDGMRFLLATDGLYDGFENVDMILNCIRDMDSHHEIIHKLYEYARWDNGSDDCTIISGTI